MSVPSNDMTAPGNGLAAGRVGRPGDGGEGVVGGASAPARRGRNGLLALSLIGIGSGVLVGATWVVIAPLVVRWTGSGEEAAAHDATFGLLGVLAGLVTAVALLVWPGARPALQAGLVITAATGSSLLAWGVGELLGAPRLHAVALVVVWPLVAAALTMIRSLIAVLFSPS